MDSGTHADTVSLQQSRSAPRVVRGDSGDCTTMSIDLQPANPLIGTDADLPSTDPASLERLKRFGGGKLLGEMISLFIRAAPERIGAARAALEVNDAGTAEMALHSLKSSSAQLGALQMQRLSEQGERLAHSGSLSGVDRIVQDLEEEFPRVQIWLERARNVEAT